MSRKLFLKSFGCQMNDRDAERITGLMRREGYETTEVLEEADVVVVHTCSIRQKAEEKAYGLLGRTRALRQKNPGLQVAIGGCVAQQQGAELMERNLLLDVVFGTHQIRRLPELLEEARRKQRSIVRTEYDYDPDRLEGPLFWESTGDGRAAPTSALVTVQEGCNKSCTYCVVPRTKGAELCRPSSAILDEVRRLVERGVQEIVLIGQTVNSYGKDGSADISFPDLLRKCSNVEGVGRIRFATSYPPDVTEALAAAMAECEPVCEHLHLPVQSGSSRVLAAMNRGYSRGAYLEKVRLLRSAMPDLALSTDIIVGFPGETEEDFSLTLDLVQAVGYDQIYGFCYSKRPGTQAPRMEGHIPDEVKKERLVRLFEAAKRVSMENNSKWIGRDVEVLIEGPSPDGERMQGRTRWNRLVHTAGAGISAGDWASVRVERISPQSLIGQALRVAAPLCGIQPVAGRHCHPGAA
ncbi:MAG: tRNA (N6-isopentenyl adenosine(37)-C2)-methylthiotransferase MiaB [Nitrospirae bacterium]|nr:tRNA (N6-isopentenyl adenosine(37)-C2)-methylthiotransferase MiaB [Nitrospirota bacterium]